jgi:hypothetical protein
MVPQASDLEFWRIAMSAAFSAAGHDLSLCSTICAGYAVDSDTLVGSRTVKVEPCP